MHRAAEDFLGKEDGEPVAARELLRRHGKGEVVILDVRPAEEYLAGHLAGAISVPLPELTKRIADLPKRKEIVAYCRGPYCVMAAEAVTLLRKRGFRARRIDEGIADWKALGLRVETGSLEKHP
jgi:rhodanese-related sulfurtransferase